jgi:hypothetical protein
MVKVTPILAGTFIAIIGFSCFSANAQSNGSSWCSNTDDCEEEDEEQENDAVIGFTEDWRTGSPGQQLPDMFPDADGDSPISSGGGVLSVPGDWTYYSSNPAHKGMIVNGSEYVIIDTTSFPIKYSLGATFNQIIDRAGNISTYFGFLKKQGGASPLLIRTNFRGGGIMTLLRDSRMNVIKRTYSSTDNTTVLTSETHFSTDCLNILTCNKPEWAKDVSGNQTDFEYDPVHGNLVRETGPAVNGVRPETRYQYGQRYTWLKGSGSAYVKSADPIWVLESESYCRTSNHSNGACAAGASDEVVTTYDHGPDSGPNNLWLRGTAVTSEGVTLRSCITYDDFGNVIAETSPNANQSSCS